MKLSTQFIQHLADRFEWKTADEYGEPGYSTEGDETPLVVFGNYWCDSGRNTDVYRDDLGGTSHLHHLGARFPRIFAKLEEQGVGFEWDDEWVEIDGKAYRTQPDSYRWQPSWYKDEDGEMFVLDDEQPNVEHLVATVANKTHNAIHLEDFRTSLLADAGFTKYNGQFENGWHPGQDDDPTAITEAIRQWATGPVDIVFVINGVGQFDMEFSAWTRPTKLSAKTSSSFKLWKERIESGVVTHAQATQFAKAIHTRAHGMRPGGKHTNITAEEAVVLVNMIEREPVRVDDSYRYQDGMHTYDVARRWLVRQSKRADNGVAERYDFATVESFYFAGCCAHPTSGWAPQVYPIYECRWADGRRLRYSPTPWQAGAPKAKAQFVSWELEPTTASCKVAS